MDDYSGHGGLGGSKITLCDAPVVGTFVQTHSCTTQWTLGGGCLGAGPSVLTNVVLALEVGNRAAVRGGQQRV